MIPVGLLADFKRNFAMHARTVMHMLRHAPGLEHWSHSRPAARQCYQQTTLDSHSAGLEALCF